jgi:hypothetical protein
VHLHQALLADVLHGQGRPARRPQGVLAGGAKTGGSAPAAGHGPRSLRWQRDVASDVEVPRRETGCQRDVAFDVPLAAMPAIAVGMPDRGRPRENHQAAHICGASRRRSPKGSPRVETVGVSAVSDRGDAHRRVVAQLVDDATWRWRGSRVRVSFRANPLGGAVHHLDAREAPPAGPDFPADPIPGRP